MIFMDQVIDILTLIVALNIWVTLGGLITYFIEPEHVSEYSPFELMIMYFMFPIIIALSLIESRDASKPDTK